MINKLRDQWMSGQQACKQYIDEGGVLTARFRTSSRTDTAWNNGLTMESSSKNRIGFFDLIKRVRY